MDSGKIIAAAILVLVAAGLAAASLLNHKEKPHVTVATIQFGISTLDLIDSGQYKPSNIDIDVMRIQLAPDVATALLKGDAQVAILPVEVAAKLYENGNDVVIIAIDMYQNQAILVPVNSTLKTPADLKGKTVAAPVSSGSFAVFKSYMKTIYGLDVLEPGEDGKGVHVVNTKPAQALDAAVKGDADAAVVWEPIVSKALASGRFRILASFQDLWKMLGGKGEPVMIAWVARGDWVRSHPDQVEALLEARQAAAKLWVSNKDAVYDSMRKLYNLDEKTITTLYDRVDICTERRLTSSLVDSVKQVVNLAYRGGYLKTASIDYNKFLYTGGT